MWPWLTIKLQNLAITKATVPSCEWRRHDARGSAAGVSQQILDVDWQLADPNSGGMIDVRGQSCGDTSVTDRTNAPRPEFFEHRFQAGRPFMMPV